MKSNRIESRYPDAGRDRFGMKTSWREKCRRTLESVPTGLNGKLFRKEAAGWRQNEKRDPLGSREYLVSLVGTTRFELVTSTVSG